MSDEKQAQAAILRQRAAALRKENASWGGNWLPDIEATLERLERAASELENNERGFGSP